MTTRRRLLRNIIAAGAGSAALGLSAASGAPVLSSSLTGPLFHSMSAHQCVGRGCR